MRKVLATFKHTRNAPHRRAAYAVSRSRLQDYWRDYATSWVQCRGRKAVNQKPGGLQQALVIPTRQRENIGLGFVTHLPMTKNGNGAILVIVDYQ